MSAAPPFAPRRTAKPIAALLAAAVACLLALGAGSASAAGFGQGEIIVAPQSQSVPDHTVTRPTDGKPVAVWDVLREAADAGTLDLDSFPRLTIAGRTLSRDQVKDAGSNLNVVFEPTQTTINLPGGGSAVYGEGEQFAFTPKIVVFPKAADFKVTLAPKSRTVKSGAKVRFNATVNGTTGTLSYSWSFGDGSPDRQTATPTIEHIFRGTDRQFPVSLTVTEAGNIRNGTAASLITIGKAKKPDKPKKPKKKAGSSTPGGTPYGGGYGDGGYGGYGEPGNGGGNGGTPGPSTPASPTPKKKEKPRPVDDGLVPVRGELLDPDIPAEVIDPSTDQPGESAEPAPAREKSGFGLSGGAKTAIGIAVLLGLGGLTELRSFARFR